MGGFDQVIETNIVFSSKFYPKAPLSSYYLDPTRFFLIMNFTLLSFRSLLSRRYLKRVFNCVLHE